MLREVTPDFFAIDSGQLHQESHVGEVLKDAGGVVLHRHDLHGGEMLWPRDQDPPACRTRKHAGLRKEAVCGDGVDVHEVDPAPNRVAMHVVRISLRAVERFVPRRFQERHDLRLRRGLDRQVQIESGSRQTVRGESEGAHESVPEPSFFQKARQRRKLGLEVDLEPRQELSSPAIGEGRKLC